MYEKTLKEVVESNFKKNKHRLEQRYDKEYQKVKKKIIRLIKKGSFVLKTCYTKYKDVEYLVDRLNKEDIFKGIRFDYKSSASVFYVWDIFWEVR